jgi:protein ImuB
VTKPVSGTRRYLALWFPFLPAERLEIARRSNGASSPEAIQAPPPRVLIEKVGGAVRLAAVDRVALALGLTPGLALADARARVPELEALEHDAMADQLWLERLADGCARYSPIVAINAPDGLLIDITGCAHLFSGEAGLAADVEARLTRLGMTLRHAVAATAEAAHALARYQTLPAADEGAAIRRLPVAALRLDGEAETGLRRAGLKTIGDLAHRPAAALVARFGAEAATMLRRLLGEADSPLAPRRPLPPLIVERRFAEPIGRTEDALAVLGELAGEAEKILEQRDEGGRAFEATLFRADGLVRALPVETGLPTRSPRAVMGLFRERLDRLADPLDPGFGFDLIRLSVPVLQPLAAAQLRLEGGAVREAEVAALVDRLGVRLGRGRLRRFRPGDSHIPEQAQLALPAADDDAPSGQWCIAEPGEPPLRPIHLFDPPQPIEVMAEVPDGPPHRFRWRRALHEVRRFEGPERIAAEWWRRKDGKGLTRDYYRVEDARGRRFWIFRHGLYGSESGDPCWYVHGLFA